MELIFEKDARGILNHFKGNYTAYTIQKIMVGLLLGGIPLGALIFLKVGGIATAIVVGIVGFIIGFKIPYLILLNSMKEEELARRYMFPTFLKYFNSLLSIKATVPSALIETVNYLDEPLKSKVEDLAIKLDDSLEREYFIDFAEFVGGGESMMVMSMLYDFMKEGIDQDKLKELETMVQSMQENQINENIKSRTRGMEKYANPSLLASIGFVFMFIGVLFMELVSNLNI